MTWDVVFGKYRKYMCMCVCVCVFIYVYSTGSYYDKYACIYFCIAKTDIGVNYVHNHCIQPYVTLRVLILIIIVEKCKLNRVL
jgi:hypothetical protein